MGSSSDLFYVLLGALTFLPKPKNSLPKVMPFSRQERKLLSVEATDCHYTILHVPYKYSRSGRNNSREKEGNGSGIFFHDGRKGGDSDGMTMRLETFSSSFFLLVWLVSVPNFFLLHGGLCCNLSFAISFIPLW